MTFKDGPKTLGTADIDGSGVATLQVAFDKTGNHVITARYAGDGQTVASNSAGTTYVVDKATTTIEFTSLTAGIQTGTSATFTAEVAVVAPADHTPTGVVVIKEGATTLATRPLVNGEATWITPTSLSAGVHLLTATYQGDSNDLPVTSSEFTLTVG